MAQIQKGYNLEMRCFSTTVTVAGMFMVALGTRARATSIDFGPQSTLSGNKHFAVTTREIRGAYERSVTVYRLTEPYDPAREMRLSEPIWSFESSDLFACVSNDGEYVATHADFEVPADSVTTHPVLRFWNRDGLIKSYTAADLCPNPPSSKGLFDPPPIGDFRAWVFNIEPLAANDVVRVKTFCGESIDIRFKDGAIINREPFAVPPISKAKPPTPDPLKPVSPPVYAIYSNMPDHRQPPWRIIGLLGIAISTIAILIVLRTRRRANANA
ncbi:MAG: hypothetical protein GC159_21380 [Phycisphaera sp.]|nr:hypothetical protein [Phycisphaera sp.]